MRHFDTSSFYQNYIYIYSRINYDYYVKLQTVFCNLFCSFNLKYQLSDYEPGPSPMIKNAVPRSGNGAAEMSANGYFVNLFWCFNAPEAS